MKMSSFGLAGRGHGRDGGARGRGRGRGTGGVAEDAARL
jgi:hypothetical protein